MKYLTFTQAVEEIEAESTDALCMYTTIRNDIRRRIDEPNEKLHYWDGKRTGLELALQCLERVIQKGI